MFNGEVILVCREGLVLSSHFLCSSLLIGSSKTDHKLLRHLATHNCICNHLNSTEVQLKFYTILRYLTIGSSNKDQLYIINDYLEI